jgi:two-component system, sensor histidine kinase and response regulator
VLSGALIARQKATLMLKERNAELHKTNQALTESNTTKNKLYSIISHDLRSPFNSLLGFSRILYENIDDLDKKTIKQSAEEIWESADAAYQLLSNLLTWTRVQNGKLTPAPEPIYVEWIISMVRSELSLLAAQKEITLQFTTNEPVTLMADRNMMETVIRNLVSNAIKYSPRGKQVEVGYHVEENTCLITVKDYGLGMPEELTASLFTVGANISTPGTEKESGTGLGLLICKEFVEINHGNIWVESEPGMGSTFYVRMPLSKEPTG